MIVKQFKTYIGGEIYTIDVYDDDTYGWADTYFAPTFETLRERILADYIQTNFVKQNDLTKNFFFTAYHFYKNFYNIFTKLKRYIPYNIEHFYNFYNFFIKTVLY